MRSDDITERLRETRANMIGTDDEQHYWDCHDAAKEIERLRDENASVWKAACESVLLASKEVGKLKSRLRIADEVIRGPLLTDEERAVLKRLLERTETTT